GHESFVRLGPPVRSEDPLGSRVWESTPMPRATELSLRLALARMARLGATAPEIARRLGLPNRTVRDLIRRATDADSAGRPPAGRGPPLPAGGASPAAPPAPAGGRLSPAPRASPRGGRPHPGRVDSNRPGRRPPLGPDAATLAPPAWLSPGPAGTAPGRIL